MKVREQIEMTETFCDGDEEEVANEQYVRCQNDFFQVRTLIPKMHENQDNVGGLDQRQHDEGPFDGRPSKRFGALEKNPHSHFYCSNRSQQGGYKPDFLSDGSSSFLAVVCSHGIAVVDNEIVAFHVR